MAWLPDIWPPASNGRSTTRSRWSSICSSTGFFDQFDVLISSYHERVELTPING